MLQTLETDYLIIGAGATGMAFVDELLTRDRDVQVLLVDRSTRPGGHWKDAYPFVTLHQPASFYGVNSEPLGSGGMDLCSGTEIQAYYERVLEKLCATGRLTFLPQCEYEGNGRLRSTVTPELVYQVKVNRKTVDATYLKIQVPSTHPPRYEVADGVSLVPINAIAHLDRSWPRYVVIGAGKTGLDAVLFLLGHGVDPNCITWIISRDAWLINREISNPELAAREMPRQLKVIGQSQDAEDLLLRFEAKDWLLRLDPEIWPTMYRCGTVTLEELSALRRITHIVRLGRVIHIDLEEIRLDQGVVAAPEEALYIDCTSDGLASPPDRPVFEGDQIVLQPLGMCQQLVSAALIAFIETRYEDEKRKNGWCRTVQHPTSTEDIFRCFLYTFRNVQLWTPRFGWWLLRSRLSWLHHMSLIGLLRMALGYLLWLRPALRALERIHRDCENSLTRSQGQIN